MTKAWAEAEGEQKSVSRREASVGRGVDRATGQLGRWGSASPGSWSRGPWLAQSQLEA